MKNGISRRAVEVNRQSTKPISVPRTLRGHEVATLTSMPAGRMIPVAAIPLLREDGLRRGAVRLSFEMHETAEILRNAVNCEVKAYFVSNLAMGRFNGMDELNRSYQKVPYREGEPVVPFYNTEIAGAPGTNPILQKLGLHLKEGTEYNTSYIEAYNAIWNFRAANRSLNLMPRDMLDKSLAPAFWQHKRYRHIVPDFDQAMIDGEVSLNIASGLLPVQGIGVLPTGSPTTRTVKDTDGNDVIQTGHQIKDWDNVPGSGQGHMHVATLAGAPQVFAEMAENGITVSLSNIDAAKKVAAFARLREQYNGHDDEYIIDMLMNGLRIPDQMYKQPMLLSSQSTVFGMSKRYASDGANLTESVVNGATFVDMMLRLPPVSTGGVIMIVAEATPDQLFERQEDPMLVTTDVEQLPEYLRDELDPEKVDTVYCRYVDVDHDTPDAVFGYEPLNAKWDVKATRVGGRFFRPEVDAPFDEDRQSIWACEVQNPTLSEDFYIASEIHTKPFADQTIEPFEVFARGQMVIDGITVFGGALTEAQDNYAKVLAEKPTETIEKA